MQSAVIAGCRRAQQGVLVVGGFSRARCATGVYQRGECGRRCQGLVVWFTGGVREGTEVGRLAALGAGVGADAGERAGGVVVASECSVALLSPTRW